ncbi:MAG: HD domain-containing protein [bacterium]|nr:HD domain-containing protein [bacterium]
MLDFSNEEFYNLIKPIECHEEYQNLKNIKHHGITRYDHSYRVAYYSYIITKTFGLDYKETTQAALLHDFFSDDVAHKNPIARLSQHPKYAVKNAQRIINLSEKQIDIIETHMFPITFTPPKYLESWIVDIIDDIASIYERGLGLRKYCKTAAIALYTLIFMNFK